MALAIVSKMKHTGERCKILCFEETNMKSMKKSFMLVAVGSVLLLGPMTAVLLKFRSHDLPPVFF